MRLHNEALIKRRLLRAAIMTVRGRAIYKATGDSSMMDNGWMMYHGTRPWLQFDGTFRSTTTETRNSYFAAARKVLESR
jgi:hypothetical protein